ncbi:MAG: flap endonuclease-1 [Candidatus Micrarchaeota archaeon]
MGVDIGDLAVKHTVSLQSLSGKAVAIDAFNVLYQFLASIRQEDGTPLMDFKGRVTAHLSGLFYRTSRFVENGMKPIYVFDGKPSLMKEKTRAERSEIKKIAEEKWKKALEDERLEDARKYAAGTSRLTPEMVEECKVLLDGMGIPYVQAPGEGEAQAAVMVEKGIAYATASQDYDAMLFGSPILLRNISITGRRKVPRQDRYIMVEPEEIRLQETLLELGIDRKKLIMLGILLGTDFNDGVRRVGPKTAIKIVREVKSLKGMASYVKEKYDYEFDVDPEDVMNLFLKPHYAPVRKKLKWGDTKKDDVMKLLVEEHDFSEERVGRTIDGMVKTMKESSAQSKLGDWF